MACETDLRDDANVIAEKTTATIKFTVEDKGGGGLAQADLDSLTLNLYNDRGKKPINSRTDVDILGKNGGAVGAGGVGTWDMDELDNPIVESGKSTEDHTAEFEWTFDGTQQTGRHRVRLRVKNFAKVS